MYLKTNRRSDNEVTPKEISVLLKKSLFGHDFYKIGQMGFMNR